MSSTENEPPSAEQRFRQAFERLKSNQPRVLETGTPVSQNNVAREASCDPSALRKGRFPALIREIQAFVLFRENDQPSAGRKAVKEKQTRRSTAERLKDAIRQRDMAQSILLSANRRVIELSEQVNGLQNRLDEFMPKITRIERC